MKQDDTFLSTRDGTSIYFRTFRPRAAARAALVISHGFKAHGGLYRWAGEQFAKQGLAVYAIDHRGHGNSGGERYEARDIAEFVGDLGQLIELVKDREPGLPVFLLGHSAGGVIACVYALEHQHELAGLLCESFAYRVYAPDLAVAALKGLNHLTPHLHVLELKNEHFSRDPEVVQALDTDPLLPQMRYPVETVVAMFRGTERLGAEFAKITLPLLILHGTDDKVTEPAGSQRFYDQAGSPDKTLKLYDHYVHDLLADVGKEVPLADMLAWIEARLGAHLAAQA